MIPHLQNLATALGLTRIAVAHEAKMNAAFARAFRKERRARKIPLNVMARRLRYTSTMLMLLERGKRRWTPAKATLAVKLLTRRDDWPD